MITVCPKCALTLAVTAADLRVGQGQVRCGRCAAVFNALAGLKDDFVEAADVPRAADAEPEGGVFDPTSTDVAQHVAASAAVTEPSAPPPADAVAERGTAGHATEAPTAGNAPLADDATAEGAPDASLDDPANDASAMDVLTGELPEHDQLPPAANDASAAAPQSANDDLIDPVAANEVFEVDVESIVVQPGGAEPHGTALAADEPEPPVPALVEATHLDLDLTPLEEARPRNYWAAGSVALALLLGVQAIHGNRNSLAARDSLRAPLQSFYSLFGARLQPQWNPAAFEVRRRGEMIADSDGAMTLRATVQNTAANSQPLPLLRVVLLDRFGARIGARDLLPGEYLPQAVAANLSYLAAGQRVDAEVALADPGPAATGFELDACLRVAADRLQCASHPPAGP
jgi:predicted Zn finger-like uncharacterized protein